jgi:hypothetical protein
VIANIHQHRCRSACGWPGSSVSVGPSRELINALTPLGVRVAQPQIITALIDTGAHSTVLNPDVVSRLGIKPVGVAAIVTPSTTDALICNRYHINVYFSEDFVIENVFAIEADGRRAVSVSHRPR